MLKGIHLTLMIGPGRPAPVPRAVIEALTSAEATTNADGPSGFQLRFTLSNRSPLQTAFLIGGGVVPPMMRVVLVATINGSAEVLADGVMTDHQLSPGENGGSELVVTGEDLTRLMDYQAMSGFPYPGMPSFARVAAILAKYAVFGIVPQIVPSYLLDVESPNAHVPLHQGTDLNYVKLLAASVGHTFYIEPGPAPLTSRAYWGPEIRLGPPQPALNVNMDAHTNCESLRFQLDGESRVQPYITVHEPITKLPIPIPIPTDISVLSPPLGRVPFVPKRWEAIEDASKLTVTKALLRGFAAATHSADAVRAEGQLDVTRYGRALKARRLVGVRGAGEALDGLYSVRKVTHQIQRGQYKQSFTLARNALVSTVSKVPA
jgi:hypothetical protein